MLFEYMNRILEIYEKEILTQNVNYNGFKNYRFFCKSAIELVSDEC